MRAPSCLPTTTYTYTYYTLPSIPASPRAAPEKKNVLSLSVAPSANFGIFSEFSWKFLRRLFLNLGNFLGIFLEVSPKVLPSAAATTSERKRERKKKSCSYLRLWLLN